MIENRQNKANRRNTFPLCVLKQPVSLFCFNQALGHCSETVILALIRKPSRSPLALHIGKEDWIISKEGFVAECTVPYFYLLRWDSYVLAHLKRWWPGIIISSGKPGDCFFGASFELIKLAPKLNTTTGETFLCLTN